MSKTTTEMQLVDINKLIPYVNNARTHNAQQINKLRSSLREFGYKMSRLNVQKILYKNVQLVCLF